MCDFSPLRHAWRALAKKAKNLHGAGYKKPSPVYQSVLSTTVPTTSTHLSIMTCLPPAAPVSKNAIDTNSQQYWDHFYASHRNEFLKWTFKQYHLLPSEAIDVYQDSIVILYENAVSGKLDTLQCSVKTYLFGIAKNLISTYLKKKIREKERYESLVTEHYEMVSTADKGNDWMDYSMELMAEAIKKLSSRGQAILHLFYFEKMSLREITQVLGYKSEDVAKTTKMRYMRILREIMEAEAHYS
jgi:RNA polymerase sigma factor (sigma-70 family)